MCHSGNIKKEHYFLKRVRQSSTPQCTVCLLVKMVKTFDSPLKTKEIIFRKIGSKSKRQTLNVGDLPYFLAYKTSFFA